jgi:ankyrin repeat protein
MNYQQIIFELISIQKWDGVEEILKTKIDPDIRDSAGNYLIHILIYNNQVDLLNLLLKLEPRLDILDPDGKQICYLPLRYNQINILKILLKYNEINYGIDITNFRDSNQLSPLFYALSFNSHDGVKLLLDYGARLNTFDKNRNTVLHIACLKSKYEFVKLFLNYYPDMIRSINIEKQTILHTSIIGNNNKIIKLILQNDDEKTYLLNSQDKNDRTALMYALELQINDIINELVDTSMDLQDANGNTHYHLALKFNIDLDTIKLPNITDKLIALKTDIDGNTVLHLLFLKNKRYYFPDILKISSFLIQNNENNTVLHLLLQDDWTKYKNIIENQKFSLFLKNKNGISPFDILVSKKLYDSFLPLAISAYYNQLTSQSNKEYMTDWENKCSVKKLNQNQCEIEIKNNIKNGISYPQKKKNYCIDINKKNISLSSYLGITIDIIGGLILLKELIKNRETFKTTMNLDNIITNNKLSNYYLNHRIIRNDLINFEIIWSFQTIFFPDTLDTYFSSFLLSNDRYFIIPIGIELAQGSHANILIFDKKLSLLERFEPDGSNTPNDFNYFPDELDTYIYQYFIKLDNKFKYITPKEGSPRISFQRYESLESQTRISDPRGYCGAWCSWYSYQRVNSGLPMKKLIPKLLQKIRGNNLLFKQVIRNYANLMASIRDKIFKESKLDLEDWFSSVSNDKLIELSNNIKKLI